MFKISLLVTSLVLVVSAAATSIQVCGTGLGADCQTLAPYSSGATDLHYVLTAVPPAGPGPNAVVGAAYLTQQGVAPVGGGSWMDNGPSSAWIAPTANQDDNVQGSDWTNNLNYVYETTFTLPTLFSSAMIGGLWSTDNAGIAILLNGHDIGSTIPYGTTPGTYGFQNFTAFSVDNSNSWFQAGVNTLDFVVANGNGGSDTNGPSGLRVQIAETSLGDPTPEPATFGLMLLGLPAAWLLKRKRTS